MVGSSRSAAGPNMLVSIVILLRYQRRREVLKLFDARICSPNIEENDGTPKNEGCFSLASFARTLLPKLSPAKLRIPEA